MSQLIVRIALFLVAIIAMVGGTVQMYLGQPDTSQRLDNVHRFMAGVYFSTGLISPTLKTPRSHISTSF